MSTTSSGSPDLPLQDRYDNLLACYQLVMDGVQEGVALFDSDGKLIDCNKACKTMLEADDPQKIEAMLSGQGIHWQMNDLDENPIEDTDRPLQRGLRGEAFTNCVVSAADHHEKLFLSFNVHPKMGEGGNLRLLLLTITDVTEKFVKK